MTLERSHGKRRVRMPRSGRLTALGTVADPSDGRGAAGRFGKGNSVAVDRGAKHVLSKAMATDGLQGDAAIVARDTRKLLMATLRELPSKAAVVRTAAYGHAREAALAAYYDAKANEAGLDSDRGMKLTDKAAQHRKLASSLSVVAIDQAAVMAEVEDKQRRADEAEAFTRQYRQGAQDEPDEPDDEQDDDEPADASTVNVEPVRADDEPRAHLHVDGKRVHLPEPERPRVVVIREPTVIEGTGGQVHDEPAPAPPPRTRPSHAVPTPVPAKGPYGQPAHVQPLSPEQAAALRESASPVQRQAPPTTRPQAPPVVPPGWCWDATACEVVLESLYRERQRARDAYAPGAEEMARRAAEARARGATAFPRAMPVDERAARQTHGRLPETPDARWQREQRMKGQQQ
jgi:hypothetical protein